MVRTQLALACMLLAGCAHTTRSFDGVDYSWLARAESVRIEVVVEDWSDEVVTRTTTYQLARRGEEFVGEASLAVGYQAATVVRTLRVPASQLTPLLERMATVGPSGPAEWVECGTVGPHRERPFWCGLGTDGASARTRHGGLVASRPLWKCHRRRAGCRRRRGDACDRGRARTASRPRPHGISMSAPGCPPIRRTPGRAL